MDLQKIPCVHGNHSLAIVKAPNGIKHLIRRCSKCPDYRYIFGNANDLVLHPDLYFPVYKRGDE